MQVAVVSLHFKATMLKAASAGSRGHRLNLHESGYPPTRLYTPCRCGLRHMTVLSEFISYFNDVLAKPFKWTYTGRPLKVGT